MARLRLTVVLIVCALLVSEAAVAQEQSIVNGGTIHGYIIDTTPAQLPIIGVRVQIDNGKGQIFETTSAETGEFIYRDIPAGDYLINIRKSGYQSRIGKAGVSHKRWCSLYSAYNEQKGRYIHQLPGFV